LGKGKRKKGRCINNRADKTTNVLSKKKRDKVATLKRKKALCQVQKKNKMQNDESEKTPSKVTRKKNI